MSKLGQELHLIEAISHVEQVMAEQDVSSRLCECCNRVSYNNWSEFQMHTAMGAVVTKLRRALEEVRGG